MSAISDEPAGVAEARQPDPRIAQLEHHVDVTEDDDGHAFGECRACCWAISGSLGRVERKADEHEAGR